LPVFFSKAGLTTGSTVSPNRRVAVLQVAHRRIETAALQIDQPRVGRNADVDAGMAAAEIRQARDQPETGKGLRGRQGDGRLVAAAQFGRRRAQLGKGGLGCPLQAFARGGERQRARLALEEACRQRRLQGDHLFADGRLRDEQLPGSTGEAQMARRGFEDAQSVERRQAVLIHSFCSCISGLDVAGPAIRMCQ
jgi:hypothetical protein